MTECKIIIILKTEEILSNLYREIEIDYENRYIVIWNQLKTVKIIYPFESIFEIKEVR